MAQGKLKTKVKVPVHGKPKHGDRNKNKGPKRGGKIIYLVSLNICMCHESKLTV